MNCTPKLLPGDLVCEIPCRPGDEGSSWVFVGSRDCGLADCLLLHPARTDRRLIPVRNLFLIARTCPRPAVPEECDA